MGINLGGNLSSTDMDRASNIKNPPSVDAGDSFGSDSFDTNIGFDNLEDLFGGGDDSNQQSGSSDPFGSGGGGGGNASFGGNSFGGNAFGDPFGGGFNGQNNQAITPPKPDNWDKALEFSGEAMQHIGQIIIELVKSVGSRTADDIGYYSSNLIKTGLIGIGVGLVLSLVGVLTHVGFIGITGITGDLVKAFALTGGFGMMGLGTAALAITSANKDSTPDLQSLPDVSTQIADDHTEDYEDGLGDIMAELFGDIPDTDFGEPDEPEESYTNTASSVRLPDFGSNQINIDFSKKLESVTENKIINRRVLVDTFTQFLPFNTKEFADKVEVDYEDIKFNQLNTTCLKALSNVLKCEMEEVKSELSSAYETYFSFELKLKRVKGLNKTAELASEIEVYMREDSSDTSVNATVTIEGDYYKIIITKGVKAVVTLGDVLSVPKVRDYFLDEHNKLPIVTGISELGEVITDDAKNFMSVLIAGKPRSGKSWYVLSMLLSMMLFNPPEDVQFIIVDPKESNLFKTLSLMPHVAGLHSDEGVLKVMDDIILNEGARRKKLLQDNKCDDIWALRKKGISLPVLYLVIDEYITVKNNLGEMDKELDLKLQTIISQLPSQGIGVIFVPHRATGVVNKTNRTILSFTCAIRADVEDVNDTLAIKTWKRVLTNPGDIAVKNSSMKEGIYVRGAAITTSDDTNTEFIENAAKAFYKMGVDLPDMSAIPLAANRKEDEIRESLCSDLRVQYNAANVFKDI